MNEKFYMNEAAMTTMCSICKIPRTRTLEEIKDTFGKSFICSKCMSVVRSSNKNDQMIEMLDELHEIIKYLVSGFKPISGDIRPKTLCQKDREFEGNNAVGIINELKKMIN